MAKEFELSPQRVAQEIQKEIALILQRAKSKIHVVADDHRYRVLKCPAIWHTPAFRDVPQRSGRAVVKNGIKRPAGSVWFHPQLVG